MTTQPENIAPFSCSYTPALPELLLKLNCSLSLTTYQAGKLVLIGPSNENQLTILPRSFSKPMGMDIRNNQLVLATRDEIITFENSPELAVNYPNKKNVYDSLFIPRTTFHTGHVDMHDVALGTEGIWAVNTSFSCICLVNGTYNFIPRWSPPFISNLVSEDRCHLNGLVLQNGKPKYVTALGATNTPQGWRENIVAGGILMDVETNEVILNGLAMPHSPLIYNNELYMLLSASGEVIKAHPGLKKWELIKQVDGFCRGMDIYGDYMFIGMSKLRKNSSTFAKLPFAEHAREAGIKVLHLPTKALVGELSFKTSVDEIYEVCVLPGTVRPNILNTINPVHKYSLAIPGHTFWADPAQVKD